MEGYGYRLTAGDGGVLIESRPRPRQRFSLVLAVIIGLVVTATAAALGRMGIAAASLAVGVGFVLFFYRELLIASRERMELGGDGVLRWVNVSKLSPATFEKPLYDIPPDGHGATLMVKKYVHTSPGSRKLEGYPAVIWVYISLGEGAGYRKIMQLKTIDSDADRAVEMIVKNLPDSREKKAGR